MLVGRFEVDGDEIPDHRYYLSYYMNDNPMSNDEMARAESLSSASIERKKREAIKCFGISMYRYAYRRECEESEKESNNGSK